MRKKKQLKSRLKAFALAGAMALSLAATAKVPALEVKAAFEAKHYDIRENGGKWNGYYYVLNGELVTDAFFCDGEYTYFLQADGSPMKDRLTYHPDGVHVIYFDGSGHEVFSNFMNVKKSISGDEVDDLCFFDVYGYMYTNFLTFDQEGKTIYYANPYGVMECNGWFQFAADAGEVAAAYGAGDGTWAYAYKDGRIDPNSIGKKDSYTPIEKTKKQATTYRGDGSVMYQTAYNDKGKALTSNTLRADGTVYSSTNYEYDADGERAKSTTTYFDGYSDISTYDDNNSSTTNYTPNGGTLGSSSYTFNDDDGSGDGINYRYDGSIEYKYSYSKSGSTSEGFDNDGNPSWKSISTYDSAGMTVKEESYWDGKLQSITEYFDYGYTIKTTSYDDDGSITSWTVKDYSGLTGTKDVTSSYDADGTYLGKREDIYEISDGERVHIRYINYDADGKVTYDSGDANSSDWQDEYDANGRRTKSVITSTSTWTYFDGEKDVTEIHNYKTILEYDSYGNTVKDTYYDNDELYNYTIYEYDGVGNESKETTYDANGTVLRYTLYTYTEFGAPLKEEKHEVFEEGKDFVSKVKLYEYDERQICTKEHSISYDYEGNQTGENESKYPSQFGGLHTKYNYSVSSEITSKQWDDSTTATEYDSYGYVVKETVTTSDGNVLITSVYEY